MPVYWYSGLATNVAEIDSQHLQLLDIMNILEEAIRCRLGTKVISAIVDDLIAYAKSHLLTEEELMLAFFYPDAEGHMAQHEIFIEKVMQFSFQPDDPASSPSAVLAFLREWLVDHIHGVDRQLGEYLTSWVAGGSETGTEALSRCSRVRA